MILNECCKTEESILTRKTGVKTKKADIKNALSMRKDNFFRRIPYNKSPARRQQTKAIILKNKTGLSKKPETRYR